MTSIVRAGRDSVFTPTRGAISRTTDFSAATSSAAMNRLATPRATLDAARASPGERLEPWGRRVGADEDEQSARGQPCPLPRRPVADVDRLKRGLAVGRDDLGSVPRLDVRAGRELVHEVAGHAPL